MYILSSSRGANNDYKNICHWVVFLFSPRLLTIFSSTFDWVHLYFSKLFSTFHFKWFPLTSSQSLRVTKIFQVVMKKCFIYVLSSTNQKYFFNLVILFRNTQKAIKLHRTVSTGIQFPNFGNLWEIFTFHISHYRNIWPSSPECRNVLKIHFYRCWRPSFRRFVLFRSFFGRIVDSELIGLNPEARPRWIPSNTPGHLVTRNVKAVHATISVKAGREIFEKFKTLLHWDFHPWWQDTLFFIRNLSTHIALKVS